MLLEGKSFLHIVDTTTNISSATFPDVHVMRYGHFIGGILLAFVMKSAYYTPVFQKHLELTKVQCSVLTNGDSLLILNNYNHVLQRWRLIVLWDSVNYIINHNAKSIEKIKCYHLSVSSNHLVKNALKSIDDMMRENFFIPKRLVFGIVPHFPSLKTKHPQ